MSSGAALACALLLLVATLGVGIATLVIVASNGSSSTTTATVTTTDEIDRAAFEKFSLFATDISGADHTPLKPGETGRGFGAHLGPLAVARAMAIVHIAMTDAVAAGTRAFRPYTELQFVEPGTSVSITAAIAVAAADTLGALYPAYASRIELARRVHLNSIASTAAKQRGEELGAEAAALVLAMRRDDGADHAEPAAEAFESTQPGKWRRDPVSKKGIAMGALWPKRVTPFVIERTNQFRVPPPPTLTSDEYSMEYYEVKALGSNSVTVRDSWREFVGKFWAYDGTPSLCAPGRLYIQLVHSIAHQLNYTLIDTARLIGTLAVALPDAGLSAWESKYYYSRERPVTAVRSTAFVDNNPNTLGDKDWEPLGAPASNSGDPNFTPPFPAYPSGHATFGGAVAQILRSFVGRDTFTFTFVSDEYNGKTLNNQGVPRPYVPRSFGSFTEIEEENGQSRMYLGIHWASDKTQGILQGRQVADYVLPRVYQKLTHATAQGRNKN